MVEANLPCSILGFCNLLLNEMRGEIALVKAHQEAPYLGGSLKTLFMAGLEAGQTLARSSQGFGSPSTRVPPHALSAASFASRASTMRGSALSHTPLW